jgi:hypothetical protein
MGRLVWSHAATAIVHYSGHLMWMAAIVRMRPNSRVQKPFDQAPQQNHEEQKEASVEIAGLSKMAGVLLAPFIHSPLQKWHTPK